MSLDVKALSILGLSFTLVGAVLLFFYVPPRKTFGNVILFGVTAMRVAGPASPYDDSTVWQKAADGYLKRAGFCARLGFGLVALGTFLQVVATWRS